VARNVRMTTKQQEGLVVEGSDRVSFVEDISTVTVRSIVSAVPIVPDIFPRLGKMSAAFHRIRLL